MGEQVVKRGIQRILDKVEGEEKIEVRKNKMKKTK